MTSVGGLSGLLSFCACPSGQIRPSLCRTSSQFSYSQRNCIAAERISSLRCDTSEVCFTRKCLTSNRGGCKDVGKLYSFAWIRNGTVRASRADSTLSAEETDRKSTEQSIEGPSVQSHLDLLERFATEGSSSNGGRTIAEQLEGQVNLDQVEEVSVPLAQNVSLETAPLTIHQKRNIRRQKYLNEVAKRNDAPFFTTVALVVLLPPSVILGVAVATGYVQLFP